MNPVHTTPPYLSKIHFVIVHPPTLGLPSGLFPSGFEAKIPYAYLFASFVLHALPIVFTVLRAALSYKIY
jgi:hypothetical protein